MARATNRLTARQVQTISAAGYTADGGGLWLQVTASGGRSWVFRFTSPITGKAREMGLGPVSRISLKEARDSALECWKAVYDGRDPIEERKQQRAEAIKQRNIGVTFAECASRYIDTHKSGWKNEKHAAQWTATLSTYAFPTIGILPVSSIDTALVMQVLQPIWEAKTETASRLRGRIESVLDWATVSGFRQGDNPARWKGHLQSLLPKRSDVQKVEHHAALPYADVGQFIVELQGRDGIAAKALEWLILTAARSGEVRGATWSEIDLERRLWVIPSERMKAGKEHRVPLSDAAVDLLTAFPRIAGTDLVFPAPRGGQLSDMTMTALLKRMERPDLTVHGFRSTFRDWAAETTAYPREVIEHALAHRLKDKAEAAYQRGDLLEKRRSLMNAWGRYCGVVASPSSNVIPMREAV